MGLKDNWGDDFAPDEVAPLTERMTEIGQKGGSRTKERHGTEHYKQAGRLGGLKTSARGREYYVEIGRKGGLAKQAKKENPLL